MATPSVTDWISAISTAGLGVLGIFITVWQWSMTRFRPKLSARIDGQREAIELSIDNKGRALGIIELVQIIRPDASIDQQVQFESFPGGKYRPLSLPAMASMKIIIQAPATAPFDPGVRVRVGVGSGDPKIIIPVEFNPELGIYGLKSVLPPGTSRILQREAQEQAQLPSDQGPTGQHQGQRTGREHLLESVLAPRPTGAYPAGARVERLVMTSPCLSRW